jgi:hypothetical protein
LEADVGISLHFSHLETRFSFRTRLLDCIWAGLPIIVTRGDVLSSLVERRHLGWTVDYESVDDVTAAIMESTETSRLDFRDRFVEVASRLRWEVVTGPLVAFCREPRHAPDIERVGRDLQSLPALKLVSQIGALRRDVDKRDQRISHLEQALAARNREIKLLQDAITEIRQGRVMRILDAINRVFKGGSVT